MSTKITKSQKNYNKILQKTINFENKIYYNYTFTILQKIKNFFQIFYLNILYTKLQKLKNKIK